MSEETIAKALEVWSLQSLLDISIMLGILATGLALVQGYYNSLEKHLSLRVSVELWRVCTVLLVDVLLGVVVLLGYLVLNPDIMADIKMAVPFCPIATIFFAIALVLRLFHGGHDVASKNHLRALYCMFVANLMNIIGFTFIMEATSDEYLEHHPGVMWEFIKSTFRSNADPTGLELSQITFYIAFPILVLVTIWGIHSALGRLKQPERIAGAK
jgi:hypothetical protein